MSKHHNLSRLPRNPQFPGNLGPDGKEFVWGPIVKIHEIGEFKIVEHLRDYSTYSLAKDDELVNEHGKPSFSCYINNKSLSYGVDTLDDAILGCIACKYDGFGSHVAGYIRKMVGDEIHPETRRHYGYDKTDDQTDLQPEI